MHRPLARIEPRRGLVLPCRHARRDLGDIVGARRARAPRRCPAAPRRGPRAPPARRPTARSRPGGSGRSPRRRCRDGSPGSCRGGSAIALGRDLAELAADDDQAIRRLDQLVGDARIAAEQPDRERVACRRCRPCRSSCARPGSTAPRRSASSASYACRQVDAAAGQQQRPFGVGDQLRGALDVGAVGPDAPRRRAQASPRRSTKSSGGEIVRRRGRRPRARRAAPGPAGRRSPPRRRGAPVRGCGSSSRRGSAP